MNVDRVKQIYEEIEGYGITLSRDPGSLGPKYLQDQIATCRNHINNVSHIMLEVHREKHNLASELHSMETLFALESDNLLATDERVSRLPSINDRKAAINLFLRERIQFISDLKAKIQDLDYVEKAVKHRHKELRDTMSEIKLQRSLVRDEIDTRSFYGDERPSEGATKDDMSEDEIEATLREVQNEQNEVRSRIETENKTEQKIPPVDEDESLLRFLEEGESKPNSKDAIVDDFSDVLDTI